jgi:hypothetical protein
MDELCEEQRRKSVDLEEIKATCIEELLNYKRDINVDDLKFIYIENGHDKIGFFKYNDEYLFCNVDSEFCGTIFHEVLNINTNKNCKYAKLLSDSNPNIEFILHPFITDAGHDIFIDIEYLVDMNGAIELTYKELSYTQYVFECNNNIKLLIDYDLDSRSYVILKHDKVVAGFVDDDAYFQLGDSITQAYLLNNGDIIVCNYGDVQSVVIIRNVKSLEDEV